MATGVEHARIRHRPVARDRVLALAVVALAVAFVSAAAVAVEAEGDGAALGFLVMGLYKKVVIADGVAPIADQVFDASITGVPSMTDAWIGTLAYTFQIYFDFSAYLSACLGHTIAEIVEIPMNTWLFFELLLILCWVAFFNLTQDWGLVMWLVIGYFTGPILAAVLHAKIRGIVQMHCANDIREILKAKDKKQIAVYGATGHHHGLEENYHLNFWCGSSTKSAFTLDMIRVVCLAQAIYVAVAVTTYVPQAFAASCGPAMAEFLCLDPLWVKCTFLVIMFLPPIIVITKMPRILEDFTVASNIDTMVHHRILSNVQRRSKTVAAFEALKVVQCLRDPRMLLRVVSRGSGRAGRRARHELIALGQDQRRHNSG